MQVLAITPQIGKEIRDETNPIQYTNMLQFFIPRKEIRKETHLKTILFH